MLKVKVKEPYTVYIGSGKIVELNNLIKEYNRALIVFDSDVYKLYKDKVSSAISKSAVDTFILEKGEDNKGVKILSSLLEKFNELNLNKRDVVISVGGGAILDLVGFACAIYKRGIPYINIPTTLLSMLDASVGGKTAIDAFGVKNNLGVIYHPKAVIIDVDFLASLPQNEILNGLSEALKCAIIGSPKLFKKLNAQIFYFQDIIYHALKVKIKLVEKDENDFKERRLLNLGHTFGHAIESESNFKIPHGEAVATGMLISAFISHKLGYGKDIYGKIKLSLTKLGIKYETKINDEILNYVMQDKKVEGDKINFILPIKVGKCKTVSLDGKKIKELINGR